MDTQPLKVYIGELVSGESYLPFLRPNLAPGSVVLNAFSEPDAFSSVKTPFLEIVQDPATADYFLIPHNYFHIEQQKVYIENFEKLAE